MEQQDLFTQFESTISVKKPATAKSAVRAERIKSPIATRLKTSAEFADTLRRFQEFGKPTFETTTPGQDANGHSVSVPTFVNEFWTSAQRAASRLHEVSYR